MKLVINGRHIFIKWAFILSLMLLVGFGLVVGSDLEYNTAFVDEAMYANVGEEFMRKSFWDAPLSWMGGSYAYPILSANINRIWGLWGIRFAAMAMVLLTAIIIGRIGKRIAGQWGEPLAMAFYLLSAPTLAVAQLATYDAPSMLAFTIGMWALINSTDQEKKWKKYLWVLLSGISVGGSILVKYVTVLVSAPLALMHLRASKHWFLGGFFWAWIILAIVGPYILINHEDLYSYATGGHSIEPAPRAVIATQMITQIPAQVIGFLLAIGLLIKRNVKAKSQYLLLLLIGAAPIIYHLGSGNIRSFTKHLSLASAMWAPVCAWAVIEANKLYRKYQRSYGLVANTMQLASSMVMIAIFTSLWSAFSLHWRFERSWPSANETVAYLDANLETGDKVFAEGSATFKYHLFRGFGDPGAWPSTWYFEKNGKFGAEAMKIAISEKQFRYIVLNNYFTNEINQAILPTVREHYRQVMNEEYLLSGVHPVSTTVWERKPEPKKGFFDLLVSSQREANLL